MSRAARRFACRVLPALLLAGAVPAPGQAEPAPCRPLTFERAAYTVCTVDLRRHAIRLYWQKSDGAPYGYLNALPKTATSAGPLLAAMNAGMYDPAYKPVGLYVEGGRELVAASTRGGYGNFHLKPNGIFWAGNGTAGVLETSAYLKAKPAAEIATQSGPMLVVNGRIHPRFSPAMSSAKRRNGVGVLDDHTAVFAISDGEVTLFEFARLYRDGLKTPNALFLDGGSVPTLYDPATREGSNLLPLGPMLGIYARGK